MECLSLVTAHHFITSPLHHYLLLPLHSNRAAANMALGRLSETIADCHQAISRDPGYAKAYLRRARALSVIIYHHCYLYTFNAFKNRTPQSDGV